MSKDLEKEFDLVVDKIIRSAELISDEECVEIKLEDLAEDFENKKSTKPAWMEFLDPFLDTYDFNFFINNRQKYIDRVKDQDQKIADLEAKLAESEKLKDDALYNYAWLNQELSDTKQKLKDNENAYKILCCNHQNLGMAYNELEQQLAQKDKEIEKLKTTNDRLYKKNKKLENQIVESNIRFYKKGALEQLEKVKDLCKKKFEWFENSEWEGDIYDKSDVSNAYFDIEANIDELIEQLTHQHEDKGE